MIYTELNGLVVGIEEIDDCNINVYKIENGGKTVLSGEEFHELSKDDKEKIIIAIRDL